MEKELKVGSKKWAKELMNSVNETIKECDGWAERLINHIIWGDLSERTKDNDKKKESKFIDFLCRKNLNKIRQEEQEADELKQENYCQKCGEPVWGDEGFCSRCI